MLLGGYGYYSQNQNVPPSSKRAFVYKSSFRNTSMPLQDITMSQTLPLMNKESGDTTLYDKTSPGTKDEMLMIGSGGRSSNGGGSGGSGICRTMKEYEDKLRELENQNFDLKVRIFYSEGKHMVSPYTGQNAVKKSIELKDEIESLRNELMQKQELLNQAAKAFELIEKEKEETVRNQAQYQQYLENEKMKVTKLERELAEYREREINATTYYKEVFGITPEQALENTEKLQQMEELVTSLEAEMKQMSNSLNEERSWAQELENERDQFRERLDVEMRLWKKQDADRVQDIEELREKLKELEEQLFKKDTVIQQYKNDLIECDRLFREKSALLQEKCKAYEEVSQISEKRKNQIVQLRASVKTRDDALTDLNNKHRALLSQCENNYSKRSPSSSPSNLNLLTGRLSLPTGQKVACIRNIMENDGADMESSKEKKLISSLQTVNEKQVKQLIKELEERSNDVKQQEEARKQLILKLCNAQKQVENSEQRLKKMESEHEKAIKAIQGFMEREKQIRDENFEKERRILELETELRKLRDCDKQRFEDMESKINDLHNEIETIKAEKIFLEKQIQIESEELQERLHDKEQKIEILETEKQAIAEELKDKITELDKLRHAERDIVNEASNYDIPRREELFEQLNQRNAEIEEKDRKVEQLTKELQVKTQNLQKLVNTELWSKNKEIAKLHNHMTASYSHDRSRNRSDVTQEENNSQLTNLIRQLEAIGMRATFVNESVQLNYIDGDREPLDAKQLNDHIQKLMTQRNDLEREVDYLKWLKLVSRPDIAVEMDCCVDDTERGKKRCDLLRTYLNDLVKFIKEMLKSTVSAEYKRMVLDVLLSSKVLSDDFVGVLESMFMQTNIIENRCDRLDSTKKDRFENVVETVKNQASTQSDSEAFSEPDRTVSMARIGLQETQHKTLGRCRFMKYPTKICSDSEDSADCVFYHKTHQNDLNDLDINHQIQELKETNNMLCSELSTLRNDLITKVSFDSSAIDELLTPFIAKLDKLQRFCEKSQIFLEKKIHEYNMLKKENKQNGIRKMQLEKKINDVEHMASEMTKQKVELLRCKENIEKKTTETLLILNKENESLRARIKHLEEEIETARTTISANRKELDHLTLSHSQILVENTKLTNDKLRLEQEIRKMESQYDMTTRSLHDKFKKEISDLNQINDSHRTRVQELETANKEFSRHMAVCEASDSAPSSSGVSSIPTDTTLKQTCDDILQEYQSYNNPQYWQSTNYFTIGGHSKSSCSPDLGIESDAAVTTMRPLKDTLKITESMTNLLSDEESESINYRVRDTDSQSPVPIEGLDEIEVLKQENETLKRRLIKTRKALEDTFEHLSASNKNKKNVEKAIIKQLMITKNILKKTEGRSKNS